MTVKEYKFIYPPTIYSKYGFVVYVGGTGSNEIGKFLNENYDSIRKSFASKGLVYHHLSTEILERYQEEEGISIVLDPDSDSYLDEELLYHHTKELASDADVELLKYFDEDEKMKEIPPSLFFCDRKWHDRNSREVLLKSVAFDVNGNFESQIKEMVELIATYFPQDLFDKRPALALDAWCFHMTPQQADYLMEQYRKLRGEGVTDDEIMKVLKRAMRRHKNGGNIIITKDYRIILEEFGNKELEIADLPKALYLFYLKHDEGVEIADLPMFMPELAYIYIKTRKDTRKLDILDKIDNLVTRQHYNNFKKIRNAFQKAYDLERNSNYSVEPDKKQSKLLAINIPEKQREWHCPDISNKVIPMLPAHANDYINATWEILHNLNDSKVNEAIGEKPSK